MIVVCGATGQQGGAVIDALIALGLGPIRGLTRDVTNRKALALRARGVEMVQADLANADSLAAAFDGARTVFAVTQPWTADYKKASPWAEVDQGKAIIDAAQRMKVEHMVFSTVILDGLHRKTGVPHVDSKIEIEMALAKSNHHPGRCLALARSWITSEPSFSPWDTRQFVDSFRKKPPCLILQCGTLDEPPQKCLSIRHRTWANASISSRACGTVMRYAARYPMFMADLIAGKRLRVY
jgi:hypothetical protein